MADDAAEVTRVGAALLALQAEDLHLDQLAYRWEHLAEKSELVELGKRDAALSFDRESVNSERSILIERQNVLEAEIAEAEARLSSMDEKARSGAIKSFRDQEALSTEMGQIARHKGELEDLELEIMVELEPQDAALASVEAEAEAVLETRTVLEAQIAAEESEIARQVAIVTENRLSAAESVPAELLAEYEKLRGHLGGIGVARVVHGTCAGCNLHLSATELDRIHKLTGDELEHCEQCGRLLVP
jgi:predicted  nucleic acid-binding Zn-ribbon protein